MKGPLLKGMREKSLIEEISRVSTRQTEVGQSNSCCQMKLQLMCVNGDTATVSRLVGKLFVINRTCLYSHEHFAIMR